MALTPSTMLPLGTAAPPFDLPVAAGDSPFAAPAGGRLALGDLAAAPALVVLFTCNHCPYAVAVEARTQALARAWPQVAFVAISSNDADAYPADSFAAMQRHGAGWPYPYLYDESQAVARAYDAACTPDYYLFDADRRLVYRGRLDDGRPGREATTTDLGDAIGRLLETGAVTGEQTPSMGCSIKWRP